MSTTGSSGSSASNSGPGGRDDVVRIKCPKLDCQRILAVPINARGKLVRCRNCGTNIKIPIAAPRNAPTRQDRDKDRDKDRDAA